MSSEYAFFAIQRVKLDAVTYPDGRIEMFDAGKGQAVADDYNATHDADYEFTGPLAIASNPRPSQRQHSDPAVSIERRTWAADLFLPEGRVKLDIAPTGWTYGFPIDEVVATLNRLSIDGWRVLHVSEDRGLYLGATTDSDASVTKARYLLIREG